MEEPKPPENRNINTGGGNYTERIEGNYIQGNFFKRTIISIFRWTINIFVEQTTTPVGNPARPENERILLAAVKEEVTTRLRDSLHNAVLINLGKESQPPQVKRPYDAYIKMGRKPPEPLPDTTTILEVFDSEEIAGKLLILGNPGAGKTTTMLDLAKALIARVEQDADYPIPVLFDLSTWKDDKQSIRDWLVVELKSKYKVRKDIAKQLVDNAKLLPMLDGLDELESVRQKPCVRKINDFLQSEWLSHYLVVCSRLEEYEKVVRGQWQQDDQQESEEISQNHEIRLYLNAGIRLQPFTDEQIQAYLAGLNQIELWKMLLLDSELLKLVRTPLFLSVLGFISFHKTLSLQEWKTLTSTEARLEYLLDAYWKTAITRELVTQQMESQGFRSRTYRKKNPPSKRQTRKWLVFLARQLQYESQPEFLIEKIQPSWLPTKRLQRFYYTVIGLIFSLIFCLIGGLIAGGSDTLILYLIGGLIVGIGVGLNTKIEITEIEIAEGCKLKWSWKKARIGMFGGTIGALIVCLISSLRSNNWGVGLSIGFASELIVGLFGGLSTGLIETEVEIKPYPNQRIWKSAQKALITGLAIGLIILIIAGTIGMRTGCLKDALTEGVKIGLSFGLIACFFLGGKACLQHFTLRLILYFNHYIPWDYACFLDYATERLFCQRVGGRYRFIHRLIQNHFATKDMTFH